MPAAVRAFAYTFLQHCHAALVAASPFFGTNVFFVYSEKSFNDKGYLLRTENEKSIDANADTFEYSLVSNITKVLVILFALFQCLVLVMCCSPRPAIKTSTNPLRTTPGPFRSLESSDPYPPCIIENKKIFHYMNKAGIGTLEQYHGFKKVKDKGVFVYENAYGEQQPLISYLKPWYWETFSSTTFHFAIYEKQDEYVVYYYGDDPGDSIENIVVESNPFSKNLVVKRLDPSYINKLYLENAKCFGDD